MDAQELRNLQEAYNLVYSQVISESECEDEEEGEKEETPKMKGKKKEKKEKKDEMEMKEEVDLFDYLLEYLVAEGYADTNKAALAIMANMSEEWRHSIMERAVITTTGEKAPKAVPSQMFPNAPRMGAERPFQAPFINPSGAPFKGASKSVKKDIKTA